MRGLSWKANDCRKTANYKTMLFLVAEEKSTAPEQVVLKWMLRLFG